MKDKITVILTGYKRLDYLKTQVEAIKQQTIKPHEIWLWVNTPEGEEPKPIPPGLGIKVIWCNTNFKFHGRFALGLLAQTKYVAFFDDDTIPGPQWFENCLNTLKTHNGILGTSGVALQGDFYTPHQKIGWNGMHNSHPTQVDLVGHAWLMEKDYLRYMWYEEPISYDNGEDIQLSFLAKKYGDINTYVPPHPPDNLDLWGSLPTYGRIYGEDEHASYKQNEHYKLRDRIVKSYINNG